MNIETIVICFLMYIVTSAIGYFVVKEILKKFPLADKGGFKGAGTVIGIIERIFTLTFVLLGQYTAIGLILTAKSITRFEDLPANTKNYVRLIEDIVKVPVSCVGVGPKRSQVIYKDV